MSDQPYELPAGFRVNEQGTLVDPDGRTVASEHLMDGLWWRGVGSMGTDTHPLMRCHDHPELTFGEYACYRSNAVTKGMGIRKSAFIYTLDLDFPTRESVRMQCWSLIDGGEMDLYDEAAILRLCPRTRGRR